MAVDFLKEKILRWFSEWAHLKPQIHFLNISNKGVFPKKKEIWWAHVGQNIGVEINGKSNIVPRGRAPR